jgi:Cu-Zn family superoxide dismutase
MHKLWKWGLPLVAALTLGAVAARAGETAVAINLVTQSGTGATVGSIALSDSAAGAVFKLDLKGLPPGPHGFHIHQNGECGPTMMNGIAIPAGAAGGHWDPDGTNHHAGPEGDGHMGDLPLLQIADDGTATQSLTAPHIKDIAKLRGHAIVIHMNGDNYSDQPATLGGGGARLACGVVQP